MILFSFFRSVPFVFSSVVLASSAAGCCAKSIGLVDATVCQIAHWDKSMVGTKVRIKGKYFSDFRHGAFLNDEDCPSDHIILGITPNDPDRSVINFDKFIGNHIDYYIGRRFEVTVVGLFMWEERKIINEELPPDRHLIVSAHGSFSLLKVLNFENPTSNPDKSKDPDQGKIPGQGQIKDPP